MTAVPNRFEEELVSSGRTLLAGAESNPAILGLLARYGFSPEERERGRLLVEAAERAFAAEREGRAWNFLAATPEGRRAEAVAWYRDRRRRHIRSALHEFERRVLLPTEPGLSTAALAKGLAVRALLAAPSLLPLVSLRAALGNRARLRRERAQASGAPPVGAPPPKDTAMVELAGWTERWRLLAQRVFRERPELLSTLGLSPGKAPPRLRGREALERYGERAGSRLPIVDGNNAVDLSDSG